MRTHLLTFIAAFALTAVACDAAPPESSLTNPEPTAAPAPTSAPSPNPAPAPMPPADPPRVYDNPNGDIWMKSGETILMTYSISGHSEVVQLTYHGRIDLENGRFSAAWSEDGSLHGRKDLFGIGTTYGDGDIDAIHMKLDALTPDRVALLVDTRLY